MEKERNDSVKYVLADMDTLEILKEIEEPDYTREIKAKNYAYALNGSSLRWYKKYVFDELYDLQNKETSL